MRTGPMLIVFAILAVCVSSASGDDLPITCAYFPIEYDDLTGEALFLVDEYFPASGGTVNCNQSWGNLAWYRASFEDWPEYCPNCTSPIAPYFSLNQDRGLKAAICPCASLCSLLPARIPTAEGGCICPRQAVTQVTTHDIQIVSPAGKMVSVRLFDATICPAAAGGRAGETRRVRIGYETESPPLASCRPFQTQAVPGRSHVVRVNYHGTDFPILTKTRMTSDALAFDATSPPASGD